MFEHKSNTKHIDFVWGGDGTPSNSKVNFIRGKSKITPTVDLKIYETNTFRNSTISLISKMLKSKKAFGDNILVDVDISDTSIAFNKVSYVKFSIFVRPIGEWSPMELCEAIEQIFEENLNKISLVWAK